MNRDLFEPLRLSSAALLALTLSTVQADDGDKRRPFGAEAVSTVKMAFRTDADMRAVLDKMTTFKPRAIELLTPAEARKEPTVTDAVMAELKDKERSVAPEALVPGITSTDRNIEISGRSLPARIYTPAGIGPFPVIVYYHGGGFVIADKEVYDGGARGIAKQANAVVVSADYRQAPEHKFPAAHDDAFAIYQWAVKNAVSIGGDPERIALAGESAGGNLAMATAMAARDAGGMAPYHVLAVYPVAQTRTTTASYEKYADAKPLNRPMMLWFVKHYTNSPADLKDPRIDLVHANLKGLPPVTIINAEIDPLLDDGAQLEAALKTAGVPVKRYVYEGVTHEFFGAAALVEDAKTAQAVAGRALGSGATMATATP
ncbi:MAG: alpha/beta hydrolase [Panacagrimonas sp.]